MILRLAFRNIINNGWRSLINVVVISIVLIIMVWMQAMYYSWIRLAEIQQSEWEYGEGMLRVRAYDPYDAFSFEDSYAPVPGELKPGIESGEVVPVLLAPASIYPQGRMMGAIVKGMPQQQNILSFPSHRLESGSSDLTPVVIGQAMAKSSRLEAGDVFTIRIRDISGAYNAIDAIVDTVLFIPAPTADVGTVWLNLAELQRIRGAEDMASYFVFDDGKYRSFSNQDFRYIDRDEYFADLYQMLANERFQQVLMYALLVFLAMIAVFDTQALAVFKRRREIGTLAALGFTKGRIALLFTLEGTLYTMFAFILTPILGFPLFWYFASIGFKIPKGYDDFAIQGMTDTIRFKYPMHEIAIVFLIILVFTAIVSWLPTRRIARLNPVDALRGKVN
ncbi:MAG: FtsX-like permease family protein [Candidatus Cloacimonetes bacterium]|nr:FtsX-like permease family protein [Candidatus Cloacimonadota bacterium]MDD4667261.1 FtsX-like permease family protein [Candidatus Cloacimonadota bacterium]